MCMVSVIPFCSPNMSRIRLSVTINCGHLDLMISGLFHKLYNSLLHFTSHTPKSLLLWDTNQVLHIRLSSLVVSRILSLESSFWDLCRESVSLESQPSSELLWVLPRWLLWLNSQFFQFSCASTLTDWLVPLGLTPADRLNSLISALWLLPWLV
jgi:hypothetical protein